MKFPFYNTAAEAVSGNVIGYYVGEPLEVELEDRETLSVELEDKETLMVELE